MTSNLGLFSGILDTFGAIRLPRGTRIEGTARIQCARRLAARGGYSVEDAEGLAYASGLDDIALALLNSRRRNAVVWVSPLVFSAGVTGNLDNCLAPGRAFKEVLAEGVCLGSLKQIAPPAQSIAGGRSRSCGALSRTP